MKHILTLLAFTLGFTSAFAQALTDSIKLELERRVFHKINPGVAVAVLYPDQSVKYYNFGYLGNEGTQKVDEHTLFEIGSITKTFTALVLQNKQAEVGLNDAIMTYLPSLQNDALASVTVADLLNHTAGLPRLSDEFSPADWSNPFADYTKQKLTLELTTVRVDTAKQWRYSNLGYATLGRVLENATGKTFNTLFGEVYTKIGLKETYADRAKAPKSRLAKPSYLGITFSYWDFAAESRYAGALTSTSADLINYLKYQQLQNQLFSTEKPIESPLATNINILGKDKLFYKNGWFLFKPDEATEILTHNGGTGSFSSFIGYNKATKTGIVILSNSLNLTDDIGLKFLYPTTKLKHPNKTLAYELSQVVQAGKASTLYNLYLANKASNALEVDIMQLYWLERFCFGQKKYEHSNALSTILVELLPDDWEAYDLKGQSLEKLNQPDDALTYYRKAKALNAESKALEEKIARCQTQK